MKYRFIDLFAGCGGITKGFLDSGFFELALAIESDPKAAETYALNFGDEHLRAEPIEGIAEFPAADVIVGGPPCQGFSPLNKQREATESRALWEEYWRAIDSLRPVAFVMENVPDILSSAELEVFRALAGELYEMTEGVVNAAHFGVPQRRRRGIVIGLRRGSHGVDVPWPNATHGTDAPLEPLVTVRAALRSVSWEPDGKDWHCGRNPRPESLIRYREVPHDGGNRHEMQERLDAKGFGDLVPPCWRKHTTGCHDVFGRLRWAEPSPTIRTEFYKPEKGRYLHPVADRPLTIREGAILQSMEEFHFPETQSMTAVGRQIGNAVPPLLARRIAEAIAPAVELVLSAEQTSSALLAA